MDAESLMGRVAQNLSVGRAFGTPYERDGALIIPVAFVAGGGGGGEAGVGDDAGESDAAGSSAQSGAGFGGVVTPLGVYVVNDEHVRFVPVVNANVLVVVAALLVGRLLRSRRRAHRA